MSNSNNVPTQPLIDFEAAWVELVQLMLMQERIYNLMQAPGKQPVDNPLLNLIKNIELKHTIEVPIQ